MVGYFPDTVIRHVIDRDAFLLRGDKVDVVYSETEPANRPATGELRENVAGEFCVGDQDRVGILRDRQDVVGIGALRHAVGRVEPG